MIVQLVPLTIEPSLQLPSPLLFETGVICSPGWSGTLSVVKDDLELLVFLSLPPEGWNYRCMPPYLVDMVLGTPGLRAC